MKVKVAHKKCFSRQTIRVLKKVGKLIEKHGVREFCSFCWVEGGSYRISWLVACWVQRVPYDEGDAPAFCAGPPCRAGEGEDRVPRRSQVGDLGLVTGRAQPGLRMMSTMLS